MTKKEIEKLNINLENADLAFKEFYKRKYAKKLSTRKICEVLFINACTFKRIFGNIQNFYMEYLKDQVTRYHVFDSMLSYANNLERTLQVIKKRRRYYQFIYEQTSPEDHIRFKEELIYLFKEVIMQYAMFYKGLSTSAADRIGEGIYTHIHSWILHDCQNPVEEVMYWLEGYCAEIEGHRCSCRKK